MTAPVRPRFVTIGASADLEHDRDDEPDGWLGAVARWVIRRRILVLALTVVFIGLSIPLGANVAQRMSLGGLTAADAESTLAENALAAMGGGTPNLVLLVTAPTSVDTPDARMDALLLGRRLQGEPGVISVTSYWETRSPVLRSIDGAKAVIAVKLAGSEEDIRRTAERLVPKVIGEQGSLNVTATGSVQITRETQEHTESDLLRSDLLSAPLAFIVLLLVFGTLAAAITPGAIGVVTVLGTMVVLRLLTEWTEVSIVSLNVSTALGLGLSIDYALFIVTRYREELALGSSVENAIVTSVKTAGRTVLFSALTVLICVAAVLVFPLNFLRSFGYAAITVIALAAFASIVILPALLSLLGHRIESWRFPRKRRESKRRIWEQMALVVMRRPALFSLVGAAILLVLSLPLLNVVLGLTDDRGLPPSSPAHVAAQQLRTDFGTRETDALSVAVPGVDSAKLGNYATSLSKLENVARVDGPTGSYIQGQRIAPPAHHGSWLSVVPTVEPFSAAGSTLVEQVRATEAPAQTLVGGRAAQLVDTRAVLLDRLPWALGIVVVSTFVLLFLFTGGILIPLNALVLNVLSLAATFGAAVYIFQSGHLQWLVGDFTVTGMLDVSVLVLMFFIAFGLSMDYEVFMLSRIKEEHDLLGNNTRAVAVGLQRVGRLVTAAAIIVVSVLGALATSELAVLKLVGVGLAIAVIIDATIVRTILLPATMQLTGRANWWAPPFLRRLHGRFGIRD